MLILLYNCFTLSNCKLTISQFAQEDCTEGIRNIYRTALLKNTFLNRQGACKDLGRVPASRIIVLFDISNVLHICIEY